MCECVCMFLLLKLSNWSAVIFTDLTPLAYKTERKSLNYTKTNSTVNDCLVDRNKSVQTYFIF